MITRQREHWKEREEIKSLPTSSFTSSADTRGHAGQQWPTGRGKGLSRLGPPSAIRPALPQSWGGGGREDQLGKSQGGVSHLPCDLGHVTSLSGSLPSLGLSLALCGDGASRTACQRCCRSASRCPPPAPTPSPACRGPVCSGQPT